MTGSVTLVLTTITHMRTNEDRGEDTDMNQEAEKPMYSEEDL